MKLAISGKGGVGKTTLSAALALRFAEDGRKVIAVDADPDSNLAATLGFPDPERIVPLIEMKALIAERTGAEPGKLGAYFKLNPQVDDIPERYAPEYRGIRLLVMGGMPKGGGGCFCPEHAFLRALLAHLLVGREDVVILDMEAGIEHLGRGTAQAVDALVVVVEPSRRSIETALRIQGLASDLGVRKVFVVGNKVRDAEDEDFIRAHLSATLKASLSGMALLGMIRYDREIVDQVGGSVVVAAEEIKQRIVERLTS